MNTRDALELVLDQVDYMAGQCRPNEMIGAILPTEIIELARKTIEDEHARVTLHFTAKVLGDIANRDDGIDEQSIKMQHLAADVLKDISLVDEREQFKAALAQYAASENWYEEEGRLSAWNRRNENGYDLAREALSKIEER